MLSSGEKCTATALGADLHPTGSNSQDVGTSRLLVKATIL